MQTLSEQTPTVTTARAGRYANGAAHIRHPIQDVAPDYRIRFHDGRDNRVSSSTFIKPALISRASSQFMQRSGIMMYRDDLSFFVALCNSL